MFRSCLRTLETFLGYIMEFVRDIFRVHHVALETFAGYIKGQRRNCRAHKHWRHFKAHHRALKTFVGHIMKKWRHVSHFLCSCVGKSDWAGGRSAALLRARWHMRSRSSSRSASAAACSWSKAAPHWRSARSGSRILRSPFRCVHLLLCTMTKDIWQLLKVQCHLLEWAHSVIKKSYFAIGLFYVMYGMWKKTEVNRKQYHEFVFQKHIFLISFRRKISQFSMTGFV